MARFLKKRTLKLGQPPGTLVHIGDKKLDDVAVTVYHYNTTVYEERTLSTVEECASFRDCKEVAWIDVNGLHNTDVLRSIGESFEIHDLTLEDILNTDQRPKVEEYDSYLYISVKMLDFLPDGKIGVEQVSIVLKDNVVISFQENVGDIFNSVREDLRKARGRIRRESADYMAYTLLDRIVDHYFVLMEDLGDRVEALEDSMIEHPPATIGRQINDLKREILVLRRSVWPMREVMNILVRADSRFIRPSTGMFMQDVYDHIIHVIETLEIFRELLSGTLDVYLTSAGNRLNEVMKVLTIIATIFIPLTFIVGVYGMNFHYMPELAWRWGYPATWVVMLSVAGGLIFFFKRKGWI